MNLFFSCHGIKTEWSRICSMQLQLQSMHRSRRSDLCLHFIRSRRDITQRGCAYLCAVAQHTVRYLKLWTFGIGGVGGGGGGHPFGLLPSPACHSRLPAPDHKQHLHKHLSTPSTLFMGKPHHPTLLRPYSLWVLYAGTLCSERGKEIKKIVIGIKHSSLIG